MRAFRFIFCTLPPSHIHVSPSFLRYKQGGITNIYRGFWATMARDCAASFFYFSTYELLKYHLNPKDGTPPGVLPTLFAGGCAGIMNWAGKFIRSSHDVCLLCECESRGCLHAVCVG